MIKLVKGENNTIQVKVTSLVNYSGFSAMLEVNDTIKNIPNLKVSNPKIDFTAEEVDEIGQDALGYLTVYNAKGEQHVRIMYQFAVVENEADAVGSQKMSVVIVSVPSYTAWSEGSGSWGGYTPLPKNVITSNDFAGIEEAEPSIESNTDTINKILKAVQK